MANVLLTNSGYVDAPALDPLVEGVPYMADAYTFPRFYFSKDEPGGHIFETEADFDAAGGKSQWYLTPTEAADAAAAAQAPAPPPEPRDMRDEGSSAPRSRR